MDDSVNVITSEEAEEIIVVQCINHDKLSLDKL